MKASVIAPLALALAVLTACGSQPPPAAEFSNEVIDAMDVDQPVKDCMHGVIDGFALTPDEAALKVGDNLDDVASKAADGDADAQKVIDRLEGDLAACNS